ncbi:hypothetical protein ACFL1G_08635 [Planctomycetota bacterium]
MMVRKIKNKFSLNSKTLLTALALTLIAGLGSSAQEAQKDVDDEINALLLSSQTSLLNPFTLETITLTSSESETESDDAVATTLDTIVLDESVLIPKRPPHRSPGRPWWVPGPPPWHPFKL